MEPAADGSDPGAAEIEAIVREVRERVRARYPQASGGPLEVLLADLMPVVHARDAAEAKVAAIGTVNPRPAGPLNALIQRLKRLLARALDWHVRDQVEFNRGVMASIDALIESLNEVNRALARVGGHLGELRRLEAEAGELKDIRHHWSDWRGEWERKLAQNEIQLLRGMAEVQGAFQHRVTQMESNLRDLVKAQHVNFQAALERANIDIQKRLWEDLEATRAQYERMIHSELRILRQRAEIAPPVAPGSPSPSPIPHLLSPTLDVLAFAARFRGSEDSVREKQRFYLPWFAGRANVLDVGCGRGEFLELLRESGGAGRGIDLGAEAVAICRAKGLDAEQADMFPYLAALPAGSLDGLFCAQVVEHLPPERVPELVRLAAAALAPGGVLAIETPNPECLAIFAVHFFLDPTHVRPVPHPLLAFYFEEAGLGSIEVHKLFPAIDSTPELAALPSEFRERFFGGQDYAIVGRRL